MPTKLIKRYTLQPCILVVLGFIVFLGLSTSSIQAIAKESGGWEYSVAPLYLWAKNIEGSSSIGGVGAPLDLDFKDDILENLDSAFAIHFEARKENITLFAEYNFARLDPSSSASMGPVQINADIEFEDTMWEFGIAYAFSDSGSTRWEVLGGARYWEQQLDVKIDTGGAGPGALPSRIKGGDDWWHAFVGMRVNQKLSDKWSLQARADYGYQDGDNSAIHAAAFADYRFRKWGSFFAGYRYLDNDFDNGSRGMSQYGAELTQQGPLLGVNFYF